MSISVVIVIFVFLFSGYIFESSVTNDETIILKPYDPKGNEPERVVVHIERMSFVAYESLGVDFSIIEESGLTFRFFNQRIFIPTTVKLKSKEISSIEKTLIEHKFERDLRWIQFNSDAQTIKFAGKKFNYTCL